MIAGIEVSIVSRGKVLIIDDELTIRILAQGVLVNDGFEVDIVGNGLAAISVETLST